MKTDEYKKIPKAKLLEEVNEHLEDNKLERLADVLEVLVELASYFGYTEEELFEKMKQKKEKRGGFDGGVVLEWVLG